MVDIVTLEHILLQCIMFPLSVSFHQGSVLIAWETKNRPLGARRLQTSFHLVSVNNSQGFVFFMCFFLKAAMYGHLHPDEQVCGVSVT
jgi:hypothetical protein